MRQNRKISWKITHEKIFEDNTVTLKTIAKEIIKIEEIPQNQIYPSWAPQTRVSHPDDLGKCITLSHYFRHQVWHSATPELNPPPSPLPLTSSSSFIFLYHSPSSSFNYV